MTINEHQIIADKFEVVLKQAPYPTQNPTAEWLLAYMAWFYDTRQNALNEVGRGAMHD